MESKKYGRTYHYPFSPGTTSDDRFNHTYWDDITRFKHLVHTEKLDGENNCISVTGVYARSHATPTTTDWTAQLRERWQLMKRDLGDLELFGENLFAIHSIEYKRIEEYFFVFAARIKDTWLSWEEVKFYAKLFDLPSVPELRIDLVSDLTKDILREGVEEMALQDSLFGAMDAITGANCTREGVVSRNTEEYPVSEFAHNVFKYVRKGHVQTDEHWTRNWRRAKLIWELGYRKEADNDLEVNG